MKKVGTFIMDTLQIFFPWDDDFYTHLKNKGFGSNGKGFKTLPLIYTDNTESTTRQKERQRKYVIRPEFFGKTNKQLGWKETKNKGEPIIKAEKPEVEISLDKEKIEFKIIPKKEYHMEYSTMSAFGKMYNNWAAIYLTMKDAKVLLTLLKKEMNSIVCPDLKIEQELKQNQREEIDYVKVPINYYEFSLGEFDYAKDFLTLSGFKDKIIPSLVFDSTDKNAILVMEPIAKVGILHTKTNQGFEERDSQFVIKISQDKITNSKRGKRTKVKGIIKKANNENKFILDAKIFFCTLLTLLEKNKNI